MSSSYVDNTNNTSNTNNTNKESFMKTVVRRLSRSKNSKLNSNNGKLDYVKTDIRLATEKQAKEDDETNRKIYDQKRIIYQQIKDMIENSSVKIDFGLTNKPLPPFTPDNHTRWLRYQQAMTPQPAWKIVQATAYLISKGYQVNRDFEPDKAIEFCRRLISKNGDTDVLEYKEEGEDTQPLPPVTPDSVGVPSPQPANRVQSLYNFDIPQEAQPLEIKKIEPQRPISTYQQPENSDFERRLNRLQRSLSGKNVNLPSAPPLPNAVPNL